LSVRPDAKALLTGLFKASIDAARPELCVAPHLPQPPKGRTIVIGAGKAAASMAAAVEAHWSGPLEGLVVTRYGHTAPTKTIEVVEPSSVMRPACSFWFPWAIACSTVRWW
jgi:glycerate 2-kinase